MSEEYIFLKNLLIDIKENENNILNLVQIIKDKKLIKKLIELLNDYLKIENEIINCLNKNCVYKKIKTDKIKNEYNMMKKTMEFL